MNAAAIPSNDQLLSLALAHRQGGATPADGNPSDVSASAASAPLPVSTASSQFAPGALSSLISAQTATTNNGVSTDPTTGPDPSAAASPSLAASHADATGQSQTSNQLTRADIQAEVAALFANTLAVAAAQAETQAAGSQHGVVAPTSATGST